MMIKGKLCKTLMSLSGVENIISFEEYALFLHGAVC